MFTPYREICIQDSSYHARCACGIRWGLRSPGIPRYGGVLQDTPCAIAPDSGPNRRIDAGRAETAASVFVSPAGGNLASVPPCVEILVVCEPGGASAHMTIHRREHHT